MQWLWKMLKKESWSPYLAGVLLGLTGIFSVVAFNRLLSASGPVAILTSTVFNSLFPAAASKSMYFQYIMPSGIGWEVILLVGIAVGGFLGAITSKSFKIRWNQDPVWVKIFGPQRWKRWLIGFIGAVIVQFGAGVAGGCTSGLAISGGMLLAPAAFLFMAGMFASGIIVALVVYRRRY
jgi:uncharacterized membrane protein YedE/YeeE